jgi:hypothetical protein
MIRALHDAIAGGVRLLAAPTAAAIERWLVDLAGETEARRRALAALAGALGLRRELRNAPGK